MIDVRLRNRLILLKATSKLQEDKLSNHHIGGELLQTYLRYSVIRSHSEVQNIIIIKVKNTFF